MFRRFNESADSFFQRTHEVLLETVRSNPRECYQHEQLEIPFVNDQEHRLNGTGIGQSFQQLLPLQKAI